MKIAWFNKPSTSKNSSETDAERLDRLEAGFRQLLLEWEDSYERLHRLMARVNKRARDLAAREEGPQEAPGPTNGSQPGVDAISAAIIARRNRVPPRTDRSAAEG